MTNDFLNFLIFGVTPPAPNYFSGLAAQPNSERLGQLIRMKAIVTLIDVLENLEQEAA